MNTKKRLILPAFAAIFALMFVVVTPYVIAESDVEKDSWDNDGKHMKDDGANHQKNKMMLEVQGFDGTITVPEDSDKDTRHTLQEQVTVSLSEAASGLDVVKGNIGIVSNENDEKFLVWKLVSFEPTDDSDVVTVTTTIVDAANASNTVTVVSEKEKNGSKMSGYDSERHAQKIERLQEKLSEPTGDADVDAARAQFLKLIQELETAYDSEDTDRAQEIKAELKDLRSELGDIGNY